MTQTCVTFGDPVIFYKKQVPQKALSELERTRRLKKETHRNEAKDLILVLDLDLIKRNAK